MEVGEIAWFSCEVLLAQLYCFTQCLFCPIHSACLDVELSNIAQKYGQPAFVRCGRRTKNRGGALEEHFGFVIFPFALQHAGKVAQNQSTIRVGCFSRIRLCGSLTYEVFGLFVVSLPVCTSSLTQKVAGTFIRAPSSCWGLQHQKNSGDPKMAR